MEQEKPARPETAINLADNAPQRRIVEGVQHEIADHRIEPAIGIRQGEPHIALPEIDHQALGVCEPDRLIDRDLGIVDTLNLEPMSREGERVISGTTTEIEHMVAAMALQQRQERFEPDARPIQVTDGKDRAVLGVPDISRGVALVYRHEETKFLSPLTGTALHVLSERTTRWR